MTSAREPGPTRLRLFISSPDDVAPERDEAMRVAAVVSGRWQERVEIETYDYREDSFASVTGFQEQVPSVADHDLVVGIVWKQIGTRLNPASFPAADGRLLRSGTVYELESAFAAVEQHGRPDVVVFRKTAKVLFEEDNLEWQVAQRRALREYWDECFGARGEPIKRASTAFRTTEEFATVFETWLEDWLRDRGLLPTGLRWDLARDGSPYPGLVSYDAHFSRVFHGRDASVRRAHALLRRRAAACGAALVVVGPSGSGKSSFVRAGLLPRLTAPGGLDGVDTWRALTLEPGGDPLDLLADRLYGRAGEPSVLPELAGGPQLGAEAFGGLLRDRPDIAADAVAGALRQVGGAARLVIVADQLEALVDPADGTLSRALAALVHCGSTVVIATLRSDHYGLLQTDAGLAELRGDDGVFELPPPGPEELREVVDLPAQDAGLRWEVDTDGVPLDRLLVEEIRSADALPLLQMTLQELFERRDRWSNQLTFEAYRGIGGLDGAIAARAEEVLQRLDPGAAGQLPDLLRAVVTDVGGVHGMSVRPVPSVWSLAHPGRRELVAAFVAARLVVEDAGHIRIAHEALVRRWPRAYESPALRPDALRISRVVAPLAAAWTGSGSTDDLVVAPTLLAAAMQLVEEAPGALDRDVEVFVRTAEQEQKHRRARELGAARSRELAATARTVRDVDQQHELRLAIAAHDAAPTAEAITSLREALQAFRCTAVLDADASVCDLLFIPGRPWLVTGHRNGSVHVWDAAQRTWLRRLVDPLGTLALVTLAVNESGRQLAVAQRNHVSVHDLEGGETRSTFSTLNGVVSLAVHPDGTRVAAAHGASAVVYDVATGQPVRSWSATVIREVAFTADGQHVLANFGDGHTVELYALDADRPVFVGSTDGPVRASLTGPEGHWIVTGTQGGLTLFGLDTPGHEGCTLPGASGGATTLTLVNAAGDFAAGCDNGQIQIWSLRRRDGTVRAEQSDTLVGHRGSVLALAWDPARSLLASAGEDGTVRLSHREPLAFMSQVAPWSEYGVLRGGDRHVDTVALSGDGAHLASSTGGSEVRLWSTDRPHERHPITLPRPIGDLAVSRGRPADVLRVGPEASRLVTLARGELARVWDGATGLPVARLGTVEASFWTERNPAPATADAALSPDGTLIATAHLDGGAALWSAETGARLKDLPAVEDTELRTVMFDPRATRIWATAADGTVHVWNLPRGRWLRPFPAAAEAIDGRIAVSPDGLRLAVPHPGGRVALWSTRDHRLIALIGGEDGAEGAPRFAPSGRTLRTSGERDGRQATWDSSTGALLARQDLGVDPQGIYAAWTPDDRWFISTNSSGAVAVWDRRHPHAVRHLRGHTKPVTVTALESTASLLATGGEDGTVRLWDLATDRQTAVLTTTGKPTHLTFSVEGRWLVALSARGVLQQWTTDGDVLKELARQSLAVHVRPPSEGTAAEPSV